MTERNSKNCTITVDYLNCILNNPNLLANKARSKWSPDSFTVQWKGNQQTILDIFKPLYDSKFIYTITTSSGEVVYPHSFLEHDKNYTIVSNNLMSLTDFNIDDVQISYLNVST